MAITIYAYLGSLVNGRLEISLHGLERFIAVLPHNVEACAPPIELRIGQVKTDGWGNRDDKDDSDDSCSSECSVVCVCLVSSADTHKREWPRHS